MKGVHILCIGLGVLIVPVTVASAGPEGLYVAPKIVYGLTLMNGGPKYPNFGTEYNYNPHFDLEGKTDNAFGGSVAIGYDFSRQFNIPFRAELEYSRFSDAETQRSETRGMDSPGKGHITARQTLGIQTLFLNAYYDFKTDTRYTPYIGAGLGLGLIDVNGHFVFRANGFIPPTNDMTYAVDVVGTNSKTITNFAWNVGAGIAFDLTTKWTLDAGYRFVSLGSVDVKSTGFQGYTVDWNGIAGPGSHDNLTGRFSVNMKAKNIYQHQLFLGARYTF